MNASSSRLRARACPAVASALVLFAAACGGESADPDGSTSGAESSSSGEGGGSTSSGAAQGTSSTSGSSGQEAGGSGTTSGAGSTGSGAGSPVGEMLTFEMEPFDVAPGTERQVCKMVNLPVASPVDVVFFRSKMLGTSHHFNVYKVIDDDAMAPAPEGKTKVHDCPPASEQLSGDAAYIFGAATPEREVAMPPGVAFHLLPGQRLILEQHVINFTGETIQGGVDFEMGVAAEGAVIEHHADILWFANWGFYILPNQEASFTTHCTVPYAVELFGLMSHTHALGTHFSIEKWTKDGTTHLYDSFDWAHPPYTQYAPPVHLAAGEGLEWTCTWKNVTSKPVGPGKSSTDEMCITFGYAYPTDSLAGDPIQCN